MSIELYHTFFGVYCIHDTLIKFPMPLGPYIAVILCVMSWSSFHVVSRYAIGELSEFIIPMCRSFISVPIVALIMVVTDKHLFYIDKRDIPFLMLLGAVGAGFNQILFIYGLALTSAADGGISQPLITVFTLLMSVCLKIERLSWYKSIGTAISLAGCVFIVQNEYTSNSDAPSTISTNSRVLGWFIFIIQSIVYASYLILNKRVANRIHWLTLSFYTLLFGMFCTASVGIPVSIISVDWSAISIYGYLSLIYIGLFASVFSQLLWNYAQGKLAPSVTASAILLAPIGSAGLGYLFLNESLTIYDFVGAFLIIIGVAAVIYGRSVEAAAIQHQFVKLEEVDIDDSHDHPVKSRRNSIQLATRLFSMRYDAYTIL